MQSIPQIIQTIEARLMAAAAETGLTLMDVANIGVVLACRERQPNASDLGLVTLSGASPTTTTQPVAAAAVMPEPEWIRANQAAEWTGLCRSAIYVLLDSGKIRFAHLRERGKSKGTRLISFPSLKAFLESKATGGEAQS